MIQTIKSNLARLESERSPIWYIVTDDGKPQQFVVAHGQYHFNDAAWPAASLFLRGTADAVATAAGARGKSVEVVQLRHYLLDELKRQEAAQ